MKVIAAQLKCNKNLHTIFFVFWGGIFFVFCLKNIKLVIFFFFKFSDVRKKRKETNQQIIFEKILMHKLKTL